MIYTTIIYLVSSVLHVFDHKQLYMTPPLTDSIEHVCQCNLVYFIYCYLFICIFFCERISVILNCSKLQLLYVLNVGFLYIYIFSFYTSFSLHILLKILLYLLNSKHLVFLALSNIGNRRVSNGYIYARNLLIRYVNSYIIHLLNHADAIELISLCVSTCMPCNKSFFLGVDIFLGEPQYRIC